MPTFEDCKKAYGISGIEAEAIDAKIKDYISDGVRKDKAKKRATKAIIGDMKAERKDIIAQIEKAISGSKTPQHRSTP